LIKWRSNLIPWAKVKGKDRCVSHVQGWIKQEIDFT
jgi:hypothetical protein